MSPDSKGLATEADDWNDLVVFCAANNYSDIKVADQHFAEQLAKLVPVLYVDPPVSCLTPLRHPRNSGYVANWRVRRESPGLARVTPVVQPFPSRPGLTELTGAFLRKYVRSAVARLGANRVSAVISAWPQYPVFGACREDIAVYWAQDDFVGGAALLGFNAQHLDVSEQRIAAAAQFLVAANPVVADTWRDRGREVILIPFGADVDAYIDVDQAAPPEDVELDGPVVGFVGQINSRIDLSLLTAVADRGRSLLLVGPRDPSFAPGSFDALVQRPNVRWVGPKAFAALPGYFRMIDVGVVPYGDSPFNRGSFPLKTLEYLAAGRGVVSTNLPATRWLATDLVSIASEPEPFADQVDQLLGTAREPDLMRRRREFAAGHSWGARATEFHEAILKRRSR